MAERHPESGNKIRVGVIFGGRSGEHEVSLMSARSVMAALDEEKYDVVPIGIDREGQWLVGDAMRALSDAAELRSRNCCPRPTPPASAA